ncbi:MAG: rod-binding protein [Sphingobium sp.]
MQIGTTSTTGVQGAGAAGTTASDPALAPAPSLAKAAQAFEAIFLRQMIGAMRSSSLSEGLFDSSATEQFRDMADSRTADEMARTSRFGIAELLMKQFAPATPLTPSNLAMGTATAGAPTEATSPSSQDEQP